MTKPLTQKQLAAQRVAAMTKEEAERVAACLLPKTYASDLERLGALFLACMRAGVNLYPDEEGWDGGRGAHFDATAAKFWVFDNKSHHIHTLYAEKVPGAPLTDALELVMLRALAFVVLLSGGEPPAIAEEIKRVMTENAVRELARELASKYTAQRINEMHKAGEAEKLAEIADRLGWPFIAKGLRGEVEE